MEHNKPYEPIPLKSLFRTFNPERLNHELLQDDLIGKARDFLPEDTEEIQQMDSMINITLNPLK
jgi:hypothetical protein